MYSRCFLRQVKDKRVRLSGNSKCACDWWFLSVALANASDLITSGQFDFRVWIEDTVRSSCIRVQLQVDTFFQQCVRERVPGHAEGLAAEVMSPIWANSHAHSWVIQSDHKFSLWTHWKTHSSASWELTYLSAYDWITRDMCRCRLWTGPMCQPCARLAMSQSPYWKRIAYKAVQGDNITK